MKWIPFIACCLVLSVVGAHSQTKIAGLPNTAVVLETKNLTNTRHPNRSLLLWMVKPKRNPRNIPDDEPYTCPDETRGSSYTGPSRVSLIDTSTNTIINTVEIRDYEESDSLDLPYAIRHGYYYYAPKPARAGAQTRPTILGLRDYDGDGKAQEFALFDALACMGLQTTLIGYSQSQDKVIQYPILVETIEGKKHSTSTEFWADYLFSKATIRPGHWKYEIDYRGRGGSLDQWEVRYNSEKEQFEAKVTIVPGEP